VNTPRLPGYTAESSLYVGRARYTVTATRFSDATATVQPQLRRKCDAVRSDLRKEYAALGSDLSSGNYQAAALQMVVIDEHLQQLGDCREFDA
jgi:hypothetical protein